MRNEKAELLGFQYSYTQIGSDLRSDAPVRYAFTLEKLSSVLAPQGKIRTDATPASFSNICFGNAPFFSTHRNYVACDSPAPQWWQRPSSPYTGIGSLHDGHLCFSSLSRSHSATLPILIFARFARRSTPIRE